MTTIPGFSSRSTSQHVQQFPQRDEATMSDYQPEPGFSNSEAVKESTNSGTVDSSADAVQAMVEEPGFSNGEVGEQADATHASAEVKPAKAKKSAKKRS